MVDFTYRRDVMIEMAKVATSILVLDHHKSAKLDLVDLPSNVKVKFDMNKSGASLACAYYFPDHPVPPMIKHIEDRDLWRFSIPGTREVQAALFSYPYDFELWTELLFRSEPECLISDGRAIERKHHKDIAELLLVVTRLMQIGGHQVMVANLPYTLSSDAAAALARNRPFGACYWDTPDGRVFSLRSSDAGVDVSEVAAGYGGGGHRNAAGFKVSFEKAKEFEL